MSTSIPKTALQLRSHLKASGELEISLADVAVPEPGPDDVIIRVEPTPNNPSDLGLLVGGCGQVVQPFAVQIIGHADLQRLEPVQHIQF